jgi:K+-transporting ATPase KdpF subunit
VLARPTDRAKRGSVVNAVNAIGLVLAIVLTAFLVIALIFPEKF